VVVNGHNTLDLWLLLLLLQDMTRTGTYHAAITENKADFEGKVVMDVGAGSGILSLFAAQVRHSMGFVQVRGWCIPIHDSCSRCAKLWDQKA
jgi:methylase of polypeptide subunit release factors